MVSPSDQMNERYVCGAIRALYMFLLLLRVLVPRECFPHACDIGQLTVPLIQESTVDLFTSYTAIASSKVF